MRGRGGFKRKKVDELSDLNCSHSNRDVVHSLSILEQVKQEKVKQGLLFALSTRMLHSESLRRFSRRP